MKCLLSVDLGTSSCRTVAFTADLTVLAVSQREYPLHTGFAGEAEQDPEEIFAAACATIAGAVSQLPRGAQVAGLVLTAAMHSFLCLDGEKRPLTRAWTWADARSQRQADQLKQVWGDRFYQPTGCPFHPMYWPAKLAYIQECHPEVWRRTRLVMSLKDYVVYRLTGQLMSDQSLASATGVFNTHKLDWDPWLTAQLGVPQEFLLPAADPFTVLDGLLPAQAETLGLPAGVPVILGASDGAMSNLGCGAVQPNSMALMVGTSGALRVVRKEPLLSPHQHTWCYYLGHRRWIVGGSTNNGGNALKWLRDNLFAGELGYDEITALAASVPPGSRGVRFLPFLAGERCIHWRGRATGAFLNLALAHGRAELARAVLEGVAFQMYTVYEALCQVAGTPEEIRATGGLTNSLLWLEIFSGVFRKPLLLPDYGEGSAQGAALLAMVALGWLPSLEMAAEQIRIQGVVEGEAAPVYAVAYAQYCQLYAALAPFYDEAH